MPFPRQEIELVGNIGKEPETRFTPEGQQVTGFSLAVSREYDRNSEKVKEILWCQVAAWGKLSEQIQHLLHKGMQVMVIGRLKPDSSGGPRIWNRQDGTAGSSFEVTATEIWLSVYNRSSEPAYANEAPPDDGEIPF